MASSEHFPSSPTERAFSDRAFSERVIAADRLTGVQPWNIGAFDAGGRKPAAGRVRAEHLPTADEVVAIEGMARDEGYRAGFAE